MIARLTGSHAPRQSRQIHHARFIKTTIPNPIPIGTVRDTRILPSDLDGPPSPEGTPNFFLRTVDDRQDIVNPTDRLEIYEARVNWSIPSFTFPLVNILSPATFNVMACNRNGGGVRDCIPGTAHDCHSRCALQPAYDAAQVSEFRLVSDDG